MAEEQEADFSKLSIEDRCQHKNWKARVSGYEDLINVFQTQTDDKSPEFNKYSPLVKKVVIDSNADAQEKGVKFQKAMVSVEPAPVSEPEPTPVQVEQGKGIKIVDNF